MRILLVHSSYRHYGGEDKVFFQERDALRAALGEETVFEYHISTASRSAFRILWESVFPIQHYFAIRKLIRKHNIELVHVHNFFPLLLGAAFRAAKNAGAVVVHTLHNYRWWCIQSELYRSPIGICEQCVTTRNPWHGVQHACYRKSHWQSFWAVSIMRLYRKSAYRNIDHFIVLSPFQDNWVRSQGIAANKITYKPNWIQSNVPSPIQQRSGFVFAGRLEASKGIEMLLDAWQHMPADAKLTIIGTGSLEVPLREKFKKDTRISFMGVRPQEETISIIGRSTFLLQTSLWYETFGLTILEAMAQGVPVIGFDIGTRKHFIRDGENGFLCMPETLVATLKKAINAEQYSNMCDHALATAQTFREEGVLARQIALYQNWINEYQNTPV